MEPVDQYITDDNVVTPLPAEETAPPRPGLPPFWLLLAWAAALLTLWPVILDVVAKRNAAPPVDLVQSSLLYQNRRYAEAAAAAQRVLDRDPNSAEALVNLGMSYIGLQKWEQAMHALQRALVIKPDFQLAWNDLRFMLSARSAANPTAEYYEQQAVELFQAGRYRECGDAARQALKLWPKYPKALNSLSICQLNLGMYDDAIASAREAVSIEPTFQLARNNLEIAIRQKAASSAAPPVNPVAGDVNSLLNSSLQKYRSGDKQGCVDDARAALKIDGRLAVAFNNIAACSNDLGRPDDAIAAANEALRLQPDFQLARNNLAVASQLKARQSPPRK